MLGLKKGKKATAPCHSLQMLWVLVPSLLGKVILNGKKKNPERGCIDPAHYFTQSSTFTIKLWTRDTVIVAQLRPNAGFSGGAGTISLLEIFSLPLGCIINVIICKEGLLNAGLYKRSCERRTLTFLSRSKAPKWSTEDCVHS